jgi:hypothetical protein
VLDLFLREILRLLQFWVLYLWATLLQMVTLILNHGQSWHPDIRTSHHIILDNTRPAHMDPYTSFKQLEVVN